MNVKTSTWQEEFQKCAKTKNDVAVLELQNGTTNLTPQVDIQHRDCWDFLTTIKAGEVDLLLTDPPYTISRKTGFSSIGEKSVERFAISMEFGEWDTTPIDLNKLAQESYRTLRAGGTAIVWYDLWKLTPLADALRLAGFNQIRLIVWQKTNPVPLNSSCNYLTNSREIAVLGVKGSNPTFNSKYDNGIYEYPIAHTGRRFHPTQKPLELFKELIKKHSNAGDTVLDPFLGSGTTAVASVQTGRKFTGCEVEKKYIDISLDRVEKAI